MKNIIFILLFLNTSYSFSQTKMSMKSLYETRTAITPKTLEEVKSRPLIVELLEVDNSVISKFNKKPEKNKLKKDSYISFVNDYNKYIKLAVDKHWKLNSKISYKTTSEIDDLNKSKKEYSVLFYNQFIHGNAEKSAIKYFNYTDGASPGLRYSRIEKRKAAGTHPDYAFFIPQTNTRQNKILLSDLVISLKVMQNHLNSVKKDKYSFKIFVQEQALQNCKSFEKQEGLIVKDSDINEKLVYKHNSKFPKRNLIIKSDDNISKMIIDESDELVCLFFLYGFPQNEPPARPTPKYFKTFINVNTGVFYSIYGEKKLQNWKASITFQDLKKTFKPCE